MTIFSRTSSKSICRRCALIWRNSRLHTKIDLPYVLDPGGKLAALVTADHELGKGIKIDHTPTVYIVSSRNPNRPYVEVKDNSQLYSTIDAVMKE